MSALLESDPIEYISQLLASPTSQMTALGDCVATLAAELDRLPSRTSPPAVSI